MRREEDTFSKVKQNIWMEGNMEITFSEMQKAVLNNTDDKIFVINKNFQLIYFNKSCKKNASLFGKKNLKRGIILLPKLHPKFWQSLFDRGLAGEKFETNFTYKKGKALMTYLIKVVPLKNTSDQIEGCIFYCKKIAHAAPPLPEIQLSEEKFRSLFEQSPFGIIFRNPNGTIQSNPSFTTMLGYSEKEIYQKGIKGITHPEDVQKGLKLLEKLDQGKIPFFNVEKRYIRKDGSIFWGSVTGYKIVNPAGNLIANVAVIKDVSEEKFIAQALKESENRFKKIFESSPLAQVIREVNSKYFRTVNQKFCELFGYSREEAMLISRDEVVVQEQPNIILKNMKKLLAGEISSFRIEKQFRKKNGEVFTGISTRALLKIENQVYLFGTVEDISKQKEYENALLESEAKVRAIFDSTADKIFAIDKNYRLIDFNKAASILLPTLFELNQLAIGVVMLAQTPRLKKLWTEYYDRALSGETFQLEKNYFFDKKNRTDLVTISPILNKNNRVIGVTVYGTEITDLRAARKAHINSEKQLRHAQKLAKIGNWDFDAKTLKMNWSEGMFNLFEIPSSEVAPSIEEYFTMIHPRDLKRMKKAFWKAIQYQTPFEGEIRQFTRSGKMFYTRGKGQPLIKNGKVVKIIGTTQDISDLKIAEKNREELLDELAEVNKELKEFAYIVSHDLKAPLRNISSLSNWLSKDYANKFDEKGRFQLEMLNNRVNRMHQFINGIFEYTKLGRVKETKEMVHLSEIIDNVKELFEINENVEIKVVRPLPKMYCEKIRIEQVFQNLISNAIKYNDKEKCLIEIDHEDIGTHFLFSVKDNGKGIDPRNHEKIFKIFQTLQPKDDVESTGIGLTIVKRIIQLHRGKISVQSELGQGTTFEFTIEK